MVKARPLTAAAGAARQTVDVPSWPTCRLASRPTRQPDVPGQASGRRRPDRRGADAAAGPGV